VIFEDAGDRPLFQLQFNIYYTEYEFVSFQEFVYIAPKSDDDIAAINVHRDPGNIELG
jgi:hypothetical protein